MEYLPQANRATARRCRRRPDHREGQARHRDRRRRHRRRLHRHRAPPGRTIGHQPRDQAPAGPSAPSTSRGRPIRRCSRSPVRARGGRRAAVSPSPPSSSSATTPARCGSCGSPRPSAAGRPPSNPSSGTEREIPADLVLLAMGFTGPEQQGLVEQLAGSTAGRARQCRARQGLPDHRAGRLRRRRRRSRPVADRLGDRRGPRCRRRGRRLPHGRHAAAASDQPDRSSATVYHGPPAGLTTSGSRRRPRGPTAATRSIK